MKTLSKILTLAMVSLLVSVNVMAQVEKPKLPEKGHIFALDLPPYLITKDVPGSSLLDSSISLTGLSYTKNYNEFDSLGKFINSVTTYSNNENLIKKISFKYNEDNLLISKTNYSNGIPLTMVGYEYDEFKRVSTYSMYTYSVITESWELTSKQEKITYNSLNQVIKYFVNNDSTVYYYDENGIFYGVYSPSGIWYSETYFYDSEYRLIERKDSINTDNYKGLSIHCLFTYSEDKKIIEGMERVFNFQTNEFDTTFLKLIELENADWTGYAYHSKKIDGVWKRYEKVEVKNVYDNNGNLLSSTKIMYPITYNGTSQIIGTADTLDANIYQYDSENRIVYYKSKRTATTTNFFYRSEPRAISISIVSDNALAITFNRYLKPIENLAGLIKITPIIISEEASELQIVSATINPENSQQIIIEFNRALAPGEKYNISTIESLETYDNNYLPLNIEAVGFQSSTAVNEITEGKLTVSQNDAMVVLSSNSVAMKQVEMLSISGTKLASSAENESQTVSIQTTQLSSGVYMLAVTFIDGSTETVKVVVK